jgi:hypothetical protein
LTDPWQCIAVPPHSGSITYYFGGWFDVASLNNEAQCAVQYFSDLACNNALTGSYDYIIGPATNNQTIGWLSYNIATTAPANAGSAMVACAFGDSPAFIDKLYLNTSPSF